MVPLAGKHMSSRDLFYQEIPAFWDRLYGEEYALYDCYLLEAGQVAEIRTATEAAYRIFAKIAPLLRNAPVETLHELGFPVKAVPFLQMKTIPYETVIGRFDFVQVKDGFKLLEFNADTPTFIRELFEVNGRVCRSFAAADPNEGEEERLGRAIRNSIYHSMTSIALERHPYVVFTAHADDIEDRETMNYLLKITQLKDAAFVALDHLQIVEGVGVFDQAGRRIDVVYRHTYPLEALIDDEADDRFPIGLEFMNLVREKKVAMLNPASAFLLQSKAVLAAIWGMHEQQSPYFTAAEHRTISRYFLPTYLDEEPFIESGERYVAKPVFGREGDTVEIKQHGKLLGEKQAASYEHYEKVYQAFCQLPSGTIRTEKGEKQAHLLFGSFIVNGKASAFGIRAGAQITDNLAYFLPCGVKGV